MKCYWLNIYLLILLLLTISFKLENNIFVDKHKKPKNVSIKDVDLHPYLSNVMNIILQWYLISAKNGYKNTNTYKGLHGELELCLSLKIGKVQNKAICWFLYSQTDFRISEINTENQ